MAFNSQHADRRAPSDHAPTRPYERPWTSGSGYVPASQRPPYGQSPLQALHAQTSASPLSRQDEMNPEDDDSDVSVTRSDPYRPFASPATPVNIPSAPAPMQLQSQEAISRRLSELNRAEDQNSARSRDLRSKRQRMDDRIKLKRDAQDRRIQAIMDARTRRDTRIRARRAREDADFQRVFDDIEREEETLRRRLKRLKRGLPLEDSPQTDHRSISAASASPPVPAYSTVPPPAKRHQSNPPGQNDIPSRNNPSGPATASSQAPSYSFYGSGAKTYSASTPAGSSYSTVPPPAPAATPGGIAPPAGDRAGPSINGRAGSPLARAPATTAAPGMIGGAAPGMPPRPVGTAYDTRPPPSSSGFTTVNTPPPSGFASVNARSAHSSSNPPGPTAHSEDQHRPSATSNPSDPEKPGSNSSTPATGKRTPSTTHPYQMSEAFANRHHHCERVDELNRGIWTSYGPGGTPENPTGPPVQMYLRCNHGDCRRIDWRTVHGLQCHIVKSHEQPKGTIGSLEKALDKYGVPITEVEAYERQHGEGSGGTMADPKNLKMKNKTKELETARKSTPLSYGLDPNARPAGYKPSPTASPTAVHAVPQHGAGLHKSPLIGSNKPTSGVMSGPSWSSINNRSPYQPPRPPIDTSKQLQGDAVMKDTHSATASASGTPTPSTATLQERKPYEFGPRPYEHPQRSQPNTPSSGTTKSPLLQNGAQWRVMTVPKSNPQSPPPMRPFSSSWSSRPIWASEAGAAAKASTGANAANAETNKSEEPKKDSVIINGPTPYSLGMRLTAQAPIQTSPILSDNAKPGAIGTSGTSVVSKSTGVPAAEVKAPAVDQTASQPTAEVKKPGDELTPKGPPAAVSSTSAMDPPTSSAAGTGPASGTRAAQSPSVSKPGSGPSSVRRTSRRSSVVATSNPNLGNSLPQADVLANATNAQKARDKLEALKDAPQANGTAEDKANIASKNSEKEVEKTDGSVTTDGNAEGESITVVPAKSRGDAAADDGKASSAAASTKGDDADQTASKKEGEKDEAGPTAAESSDTKSAAVAAVKEKEKAEPRTPPPRRAASGRITRKRTFG